MFQRSSALISKSRPLCASSSLTRLAQPLDALGASSRRTTLLPSTTALYPMHMSERSMATLPLSFRLAGRTKRLPMNWGVNFVPQQEAWVVQRLGKFFKVLDPGLQFLIPFVDRIAYVHSLKEVALDVTDQVAVTKDNVHIDIDGVLFYRVVDAVDASYEVENPEYALSRLAQSTMRVELGKLTLDKTFEEREVLNQRIVHAINEGVSTWGLQCTRYEIRDIKPSEKALHAMELQMIAERQRRETVISSEAQRDAEINVAEGEKRAILLKAEAAKRESELLAEGEAIAIRLKAEATAESVRSVAKAIESEHGKNAVSFRVAEKYVEAFGNIAKETNTTLIPSNVDDVTGMVTKALGIYDAMVVQKKDGTSSSRAPTPGNDDAALPSGHEGDEDDAVARGDGDGDGEDPYHHHHDDVHDARPRD